MAPAAASVVPNAKEKQQDMKQKVVVGIKAHRRRAGELQYSVTYEGEKGEKGHWVPASELDCKDLIESYEQNKKSQTKPAGEQKKIVEILGLVDSDVEPFGFIVQFSDSGKLHIATRPYVHKHAAKLLVDYYEKHLVFVEKTAERKKRPPKKAEVTEPVEQVQPTEAVDNVQAPTVETEPPEGTVVQSIE